MKILMIFVLGIKKTLLSSFGKPSKTSRDDTCMQGNQVDSTIQSLERNTVVDAEFCHNQESSTLNENDHMECEDKSNEHDQTGQSQLQEEIFDHQEYNEAENLKESDDESLESRKSTRNILAQLIKKVDVARKKMHQYQHQEDQKVQKLLVKMSQMTILRETFYCNVRLLPK